jgi:hypothetical protein
MSFSPNSWTPSVPMRCLANHQTAGACPSAPLSSKCRCRVVHSCPAVLRMCDMRYSMKNLLYASQLILLVFLSGPLKSAGYGSFTPMIGSGPNNLIPAAAASTVQQDFSLSVSPASQTVTQGGSTTYTATVQFQNFAGFVHLSIDGLPPSASVTVNPRVLKSSGSSIITVTTHNPTTPGGYHILISATAGETHYHRQTANLIISKS